MRLFCCEYFFCPYKCIFVLLISFFLKKLSFRRRFPLQNPIFIILYIKLILFCINLIFFSPRFYDAGASISIILRTNLTIASPKSATFGIPRAVVFHVPFPFMGALASISVWSRPTSSNCLITDTLESSRSRHCCKFENVTNVIWIYLITPSSCTSYRCWCEFTHPLLLFSFSVLPKSDKHVLDTKVYTSRRNYVMDIDKMWRIWLVPWLARSRTGRWNWDRQQRKCIPRR